MGFWAAACVEQLKYFWIPRSLLAISLEQLSMQVAKEQLSMQVSKGDEPFPDGLLGRGAC